MDHFMDGKYNKLMDSAKVRIALWAVCFSVWAGATIGLLKIAV